METLNTTLKNKKEIQMYIDEKQKKGYVYRHDKPKNWDCYKAISWVLNNCIEKNEPILDAGGIEASTFLPSLQKFGYTRLIALDLCNPFPPKVINNITYKRGDITATNYPNNFFQNITCLSVIEHGVDIENFFKEMSRIIRKNGSLIISTDYWFDKIENIDGRSAYGVPVHIFSQNEIIGLIEIAKKYDFTISSMPDLTCDEETVNWMGFSYTFLILCFLKK